MGREQPLARRPRPRQPGLRGRDDRVHAAHARADRDPRCRAARRPATESDAFLHLADAGVLFAADLVLVRSHAWMGDGYPQAWREILDRMAELDFDVLVPGHGEVGGRSDLDEFRAYLADLVAAAEEHGAHAPVPERYRDWGFEDGWTRNLAFLTGRR